MTTGLFGPRSVASGLLAVLSIVGPPPARAADGARPLDDYAITRFGGKESAPLGVRAIVQDRDGYLWLGSDQGLFRFDGFIFERWTDLSTELLEGSRVRSLYADQRGALWVGFDTGGISRIEGRRARNFHLRDGLRGPSVYSIAEDPGGNVWAGTALGLFTLEGERWRADPSFVETAVSSVSFAGADMWIGTTDAVFRRTAPSTEFELVAAFPASNTGVRALCSNPEGRVFRTDPTQGFHELGATSRPTVTAAEGVGFDLHCSRDGTVWVGTASHGLWRVSGTSSTHNPSARTAVIEPGLLAEGALSIAEDRDRNLWIGTTDGVYRLTPRPLTMIRNIGGVTRIVNGPGGRMWVGTFDGLLQYSRIGEGWTQTARYLPGARIRALHMDPLGTTWIGTTRGVRRLSADGAVTAPAGSPTLDRVESITSDTSGAIWFYDARRGLFRLAGGQLASVPVPADLNDGFGTIVHVDRRDRLWLISRRGFAELTSNGDVRRRYTEADGMPGAGFGHFHEDESGAFWLEGPSGVTRFTAERFETLLVDSGPPPYVIGAMVTDEERSVWLGAADGRVRRFHASGFDRALGQSDRVLKETFTVFDDLPRIGGRVNAASRTAFGDIWFVTDEGIAIVDPKRTPTVAPPVPTRIAAVSVDGAPLELSGSSRLPAGTARMRIDFGALDLTASHRLRFRYRLDNFDANWIDAASRRSVDYTSLGPGTYMFRVMAAHDGGDWSGPDVAWTFTIDPRFYQTTWFAVVALVALGGLMYGTWHLRLAMVRRRFAVVLSERIRVSREIHDTLLQSFAAVTLELQALAHTIDVIPIKKQVLGLRKRVDEQIEEAREAIWHLRSPVLERYTLIEALRRVGESATGRTTVQFELHHDGTPSCPSKVERELLLVAQEGIANAIRHGRPTRVRVDLGTSDGGVRLSVVDDGCGFDLERVLAAVGHCGLTTMRERVEGIGGRLSIRSSTGAGTRVEALVPLASGV